MERSAMRVRPSRISLALHPGYSMVLLLQCAKMRRNGRQGNFVAGGQNKTKLTLAKLSVSIIYVLFEKIGPRSSAPARAGTSQGPVAPWRSRRMALQQVSLDDKFD